MIGLCVTNHVPDATLSGGDWLVAAGRDYLKTRDPAYTARSSDALAASTKVIVDHGSAKSARVMKIIWHNASSAATVTWSRGTSSGGSEVATSGSVDAWRFTPRRYDGRDHEIVIVLSAASSARYDLIEIVDTANPDGYFEAAQLWIGPVDFTPTYNAAYGLKDRQITYSGKERSPAGMLWTNQQRSVRGVSFALEALTLSAGEDLHELARYVGTTEQVGYLPDLSDHAALQRYGFTGTLDEMSDLDYPYHRRRSMPLRMTQD